MSEGRTKKFYVYFSIANISAWTFNVEKSTVQTNERDQMSLHCYSTMILQFLILMDNHKAGFSVVRSIILSNRGPLQNMFCINLGSSYKEQLGFKSFQNSYLAGSQEQEHLPFSYLVLTFPFITSLSPHSKYCIPHSK